MVQPISLLMSHFNVQNNVQLAPNALAAAQDTAQGQEIVRDSIQRVQMVQANEAAAEVQKVHRRSEDEEREGRRRDAQDSYERSEREEAPKEAVSAAGSLPDVRAAGGATALCCALLFVRGSCARPSVHKVKPPQPR